MSLNKGVIIKEILNKDPLAGDVIRVLVLFNGVLWEREIKWEVEAMNTTLNISQNTEKIGYKISFLAGKGIVTVEKRRRGTIYTEFEEDNLVKLTDLALTSYIVAEDEKLSQYIRIRYEIYRKTLKERDIDL